MTSLRGNNAGDLETGKLMAVPVTPVGKEEEKVPHSPQQSKPTSTLMAIAACTLYSFCSVSMVLVNKSLASR
jgi:hypothetical protein